jgi:hypothetical protein
MMAFLMRDAARTVTLLGGMEPILEPTSLVVLERIA